MGLKTSKISRNESNSKAKFQHDHLISIDELAESKDNHKLSDNDAQLLWKRYDETGFMPQHFGGSFVHHDPWTLMLIDELHFYQHIINRYFPHLFTGTSAVQWPGMNSYRRIVPEQGFDPDAKESFLSEELPQMVDEYQLFMLNLSRIRSKSPNSINKLLSTFKLPIPIVLLWRIHLLHPALYYRDCMKLFGFILSPQISEKQNMVRPQMVMELRERMLRMNGDGATIPRPSLEGCEKYMKWKGKWKRKSIDKPTDKFTDLPFAVTLLKQLEFMAKSTCNVWRDNLLGNINHYIRKYIRYLQTGAALQQKESEEFASLSPTYNIDLIWHTHMLYPTVYRKDCASITGGYILDHDDLSVNETNQVVIDNDGNGNKESYWKYGRTGQFTRRHWVSVVMKQKKVNAVYGYIRENYSFDTIPTEIMTLVCETYFDPDDAEKELSAEPPPIDKGMTMCKYGVSCCVGDHVHFNPAHS